MTPEIMRSLAACFATWDANRLAYLVVADGVLALALLAVAALLAEQNFGLPPRLRWAAVALVLLLGANAAREGLGVLWPHPLLREALTSLAALAGLAVVGLAVLRR